MPGKTLVPIAGKPVLQHVIERLRQARSIGGTFVATTDGSEDDPIEELCRRLGVEVFRGSRDNLVERLYLAARRFGLPVVVRITADNPLVGPEVLDFLVDRHFDVGARLTTNYHSRSFPNGTVLSVVETGVLAEMLRLTTRESVLEHVVGDLELLRRHFEVEVVEAPAEWRRYDLRYCVDKESDVLVVTEIVEHFDALGKSPSTAEIIEYLDTHPEVADLNRELAERGY